MKFRRRLRFRWECLRYLWFGLWVPFVWLEWLAFRLLTLDRYGPIRIVDMNFDHGDDDAFVRATKEALDLIQAHDPRRFRILERELRFIVNRELASAGAYKHGLRACEVDFGRYRLREPGAHQEWYLAQYAACLIHEATHARLSSRGFPYTRQTRVQIERICCAEERRFVARVPSDRYNLAESLLPFQAERWDRSWNRTRRQYRKELLERVEESRRRSAGTGTPEELA